MSDEIIRCLKNDCLVAVMVGLLAWCLGIGFPRLRVWLAWPALAGASVLACTILLWSSLMVFQLWGCWALALGLAFGGIGIFPVAVIGFLFGGHWHLLGRECLLSMAFFAEMLLFNRWLEL